MEWRKEINPTSLSGIYGADVYWQIDDQVFFGRNQDSNLVKVKYFFDSIVPAQITQFQTLFPGWKIFAGECQIDDNREENTVYVRDNMVECAAWSYFFKSWIENQDIQPIAVQMSLKGIDVDDTPRHLSFKILNRLLKPNYNVSQLVLTNMDGCEGIAVNDGTATTKHTILITNTSPNTYTLTKVRINDKGKSATFNIQRQYSTDWSSPVTTDSIVSTTITIFPISTNVITFDTNAPAEN